MKPWLKYFMAFRLGLQSSMAYRADFLLSLFSISFPVMIQFFLWSTIYSNSGNSEMFGYTFNQMIIYIIMAGIISKLSSAGFEYEIASEIKNGGLSKFLVQPINYFSHKICGFLGSKSFQTIIILIITFGLLIFLQISADMKLNPVHFLFFICAIFLSTIINFLVFFCFSTLAFWMTEVGSVFFGIRYLISILGGGVFPLEVFGSTITNILQYFPFQYIIYLPINIISGKINFLEIMRGITIQVVWIIVMLIAANLLWKTGLKKYVAVGG
ncbi:ABC transporter permease [Paenibacillus sp. UNC217MF]|uniref:ABC transporter permease n=1 Tax=Paenibacillus sp. UNC217MF TaxID=1449062 RepID=UPI00048B0091|nr:ABC-2 family transporter protein [Paenibacillus sp. UNC217MF]